MSAENKVLSLKDILLKPEKDQDDASTKVESYLMADGEVNVKD